MTTSDFVILRIEEIGNLIGIDSFILNLEDVLTKCSFGSEVYNSYNSIIRLLIEMPIGVDYLNTPFKAIDIPDIGKMVSIEDLKDYISTIMSTIHGYNLTRETYHEIILLLDTISGAYDADIELDFD